MQDGAQQLREWIDRRGVTDRDAAKIIGLNHTFLSNLVTGKRRPGLVNALKVERATGIPVEAWTPTTVGKNRKATKLTVVNTNDDKEKSPCI